MPSVYDSRAETLAMMAATRAEIRALLEPPAANSAIEDGGEHESGSEFPRSRTMRLLLSGRGLGTAAALIGGLLVARPALFLRALRLIPSGAVARMLLVKGIAWMRTER